ncbi:polysaccharide deacetylase family protein [Natrialbaceae archaeon GCM10025810]|uniref:polysaccharide deacetylase family protein n=1 Tax=Halovalidus salilacus TaxID=3075124 RepID=UPI00361B9BC0
MSDDKLACVTLDLENDWYFDDPEYDHLTFEYLDDYIDLIQELEIPVTFFVVGKTIEQYPEAIDTLSDQLDCEFHLHSYQHDTSKCYDFRTEIQKGKAAFESHFGFEPEGYRAPQGNIEPYEFKILEDEGFRFDSSVFPSYRPGVYSNLDKPLTPYQPDETDELLEIPIAATPGIRIPICQSYLKLLGGPYLTYLRNAPLPEPLVFNTHLQDFYHTASHDRLDQPKQWIMKRNLEDSTKLFSSVVEGLQDRGYSFGTIMDIPDLTPESNIDSDPVTAPSTQKISDGTKSGCKGAFDESELDPQ